MIARRREFIALIGGAAIAWPLPFRAQQALKAIGILDPGVAHVFDAFVEGMRDLGYVEGQNISYVRKSAQGMSESIPALAIELVSLRVDVIVTVAPLPSS